jgi:hypothetical protein
LARNHGLRLMPLATKNGSIIVKDGRLAENCGCCGGWYCYPCDCGVPVARIRITDFRTSSVGSPSGSFPCDLTGTHLVTHPAGSGLACCREYVATVCGGVSLKIQEGTLGAIGNFAAVLLVSLGSEVRAASLFRDSVCNHRDGTFSEPQSATANFIDTGSSFVQIRFRVSLSGSA